MKHRVTLRNLIAGLRDQGPLSRFLYNFFITGNARGLFSIRSHLRDHGREKVMYTSKASADRAALAMTRKVGVHFSNYKCIYCDG